MKSIFCGLIGTLSLALLPTAALANTVTFFTAPGATESGGSPVDASVTFTTGPGTVTIDLSNLLSAADMKNVAQDLSDLSFVLSNGTTGSVSSSTGTFIDVGANGAVSPETSQSGSATDLIGWALTANGSGGFELNGLAGALAVPAQTIIGGTAGSSTAYSNANSSITNFDGPHQPFVQGTGHFVLSISGVTSATNVSDVVFSFGTTAGNDVPGIPEPRSSSLLLFVGIIAAAVAYRRRSRTA